MTNATKLAKSIVIQVSVALAFFLAVSTARNIANHERPGNLFRYNMKFSGFQGMPATSPSAEPVGHEPNTSGCSKTYNVEKGETCYSTWTRFKVKKETFYSLNPSINCDSLHIGQVLCIAGGAN